MSALNTFLSNDNLKHNYQFLLQRVEQRTGINPRKYPDFEKQFGYMAHVFANKMVSNGAADHELANLATMNNKLIDHAANFFCDKIQAKRAATGGVSGVGSQQQLQEGRLAGSYFNSEQGFTMLESNDDISGAYSQLVSGRNADLSKNARATFDMPVSVASRTAGNADNTPLTKQLKNLMLERADLNQQSSMQSGGPQSSLTGAGHPGVGLLPFNIDDEVSHLLMHEPGADLPLYQNIMDLQSSASVSDRVKALEAERQSSLFVNTNSVEPSMGGSGNDNSSRRYLSGVTDSFDLNRMAQKRGEQSSEIPVNNTRAQTFNQQSELRNPTDLYRLSSAGEQKLVASMTEGTIGTNDVRALAQPPLNSLADNQLIEKILAMQRDIQPKYAERTNYIVINSLDRDWFNTDETRYHFRVNFRPNSSYTGAGIQDLYRNVTSVELVNALIPQDCVNIPFDTRIYIDILNFPYLLLQIQEFSDVFRGTNSHNDRAFSVLVFDKQHDSSVLSLDYISGATDSIVQSAPKTQFYREYRKTFYKYTPAYFEKKVFFNQPLASLPHMTINLTTPAGENLYTDSDVLKIAQVATSNLSNVTTGLEYSKAVGYPGDASTVRADRQYIRIQTESAFSNKMFRLGDLIRIQGFDCNASLSVYNGRFNDFMNRESGHYILNTDYCNVAVPNIAAVNQGYTTNIYIAPPGDLNATNTGVNPSTYYSNLVSSNPWVQTDSKLININLQTHLLFKINTREGDISPLNKAMNV